jgi:hypothetical protein
MKLWITLALLLVVTPALAQSPDEYVQRYDRPQCNFDNLIGKGRDEVKARCGVNIHHLQFGPDEGLIFDDPDRTPVVTVYLNHSGTVTNVVRFK